MSVRSTADVIVGIVLLVVSAGGIIETVVRVRALRKKGVGWGDPRIKQLRWDVFGVAFFILIAYAHLRTP